MTDVVDLRPIIDDDAPLLVVATTGNLNWSEQRFTEADVRTRPEFRHYTQLVPSRGDFGFVAVRADVPVGVGWALFLPADDPGYGFVDESVPEISLWVRADARVSGVGRGLLRRLQHEAVLRRIPSLSLSVEEGNHAVHLYATEGFVPVVGREDDGVMLWRP
ncbi:N-acetyltransferase family protein [Georgenia muralis]